jgi:hypothetical protein
VIVLRLPVIVIRPPMLISSAYAGDHACVPNLLLARCFDGALRRAGTALAAEECVTPDRISVTDDCVMLRRIPLIGG